MTGNHVDRVWFWNLEGDACQTIGLTGELSAQRLGGKPKMASDSQE